MSIALKQLAMIPVLLCLPVGYYVTVAKPQSERITAAKAEIEHKRELLDKLREETSRNDDLARANDEIAARLTDVEARLPSSKEVDRVVRQISDLAARAGLGAPAMTSEKPVAAAHYMEQPLQIQLTGDFNGFYRFLQNLEQLPRITRIPSMKLIRSSRNDGEMNVTFTLSIYFQDERAGASG